LIRKLVCAQCKKEISQGFIAIEWNDKTFDSYYCLASFKGFKDASGTSLLSLIRESALKTNLTLWKRLSLQINLGLKLPVSSTVFYRGDDSCIELGGASLPSSILKISFVNHFYGYSRYIFLAHLIFSC
jgi:hypothetical protein